MKKLFFTFLCGFLLWGCAAKQTQEAQLQPMRYLAWLEGGYENSYRASRTEVGKRLKELQRKKVSPKNVDQYLEYLSLLDAAGRTKEAGSKIRAFFKENPSETRAAFLLGVHNLRQKRTGLARYFFERLEKDKRFQWKSMLLNNLGMLALQEGDRYKAISYFEKAGQAQPPMAAPHVNLGALYLQSRSFKAAEKEFYLASQLDPGFQDARLGLGVALEGQGKFQKAHEVYEGFLKKYPNASAILYNDAVLLGNQLKQPQLASKKMVRYIKSGGKNTAKAQEFIKSWR